MQTTSPEPVVRLVVDDAAIDSAHEAGRTPWWIYATEVIDHVRLAHARSLSIEDALSSGGEHAVLLIPRVPDVSKETCDRVRAWVTGGGALIVVGDPGGLADVVGAHANDAVDDDHVRFDETGFWTQIPDVALHALGGYGLDPRDNAIVQATWSDGSAAVVTRRIGNGVTVACGADIWQSIVRIQQGDPVEADGTPAPDGTAPIDDDLLKCEDGLTLSFSADRAMPAGQSPPGDNFEHTLPPSGAAPMFHRPHADLWRSMLLQCVWWGAEQIGRPTAWLHYWPSGVPAVAHMSHDSDKNSDNDAHAALEAFADADVRVTWCQVFPGGYSPDIYTAVTNAGHEQALHYNAIGDADIAQWGKPYLRAQLAWAQAVTGEDRIVSNKNHYTRWEGWTQFYEWCEEFGIEIDQSRGPSKQGTVGFTFGTAHVSYPIAGPALRNRNLDVLSMPLHTQDLALAAHESVRDVILDAALDQHGVAHFLFHGVHLNRRPETRKACLELATAARERSMQWWTASEINTWERTRREVTVSVVANHEAGSTWTVRAAAKSPIDQAAILLQLPGQEGTPRLSSGSGDIGVVRRHGRDFVELTADVPAGTTTWTLVQAAP